MAEGGRRCIREKLNDSLNGILGHITELKKDITTLVTNGENDKKNTTLFDNKDQGKQTKKILREKIVKLQKYFDTEADRLKDIEKKSGNLEKKLTDWKRKFESMEQEESNSGKKELRRLPGCHLAADRNNGQSPEKMCKKEPATCKDCGLVFIEPEDIDCLIHTREPRPLTESEKEAENLGHFSAEEKNAYRFWECCGVYSGVKPLGCKKKGEHTVIAQEKSKV